MWNPLRGLHFFPTNPQRAAAGRQPTRSTAAPSTSTRHVSDRELAKGVLPRGRSRICKPGDRLPNKPGIYGHIDAEPEEPYRFGLTFNFADRVPDHQDDPKLRKMPVRLQIARDDVTPEQLQAAERLKIKKHKTIGKGNTNAGGNGNIPKRFWKPKPMLGTWWRAS